MRQYTRHKILGIAALVLLMVSCEPAPSKKISGTQDYSATQFPITVHTYDTKSELNKAIRNKTQHGQNVEGLALWFLGKETSKMKRCEIHVVTPKGVEDDYMTTWGHELAHCVFGTYHKEP